MIRTFKYVAVTAGGTPQPVFGTTTSAAVNQGSQVSIPIADSSWFLKGDHVLVDSGANEEPASVFSVPDGTHIIVNALTAGHASGVYVRLANPCFGIYCQTPDGNTGAIFIGNRQTMVKATGIFCIKKLLQVTAAAIPTDYDSRIEMAPAGDNTGQYWFDGTTNDKILPSYSSD